MRVGHDAPSHPGPTRENMSQPKQGDLPLKSGAPETCTLTQADLERHLWAAADILRGSIDSADYKHYIFGLLFYKRLNDVWLEEYADRLGEYEDEALAADPEEHRFHIPAGCFWGDIRQKSTDIGTELNMAFRAIEDANPRLAGVFQDLPDNGIRSPTWLR